MNVAVKLPSFRIAVTVLSPNVNVNVPVGAGK